MGLDVLSVRCHRHNTSHAGGTICPACERERSARHTAERLERERELERERAAAVDRHGPMCGCPTCERPAAAVPPPAQTCQCFRCKGGAPATCRELHGLQLEPGAEIEPHHVREARERVRTDRRLLRLLGELHMQDAAIAGTLSRYPLPRTQIRAGGSCVLQVRLPEPARLIRMDISCDEGRALLELTRVGRINVGTRTIGEGGTLAQLDRCPLARLTMQPSVGVALCVENLSAQSLTIGGVVIAAALRDDGRGSAAVLARAGVRAIRYADEVDAGAYGPDDDDDDDDDDHDT